MSGTVTGLDLTQIEDAVRDDMSTEIALRLNLDMGDDGNVDFVADVVDAAIAAVPSLLAAARAAQRVEAICEAAATYPHALIDSRHRAGRRAALRFIKEIRAALGTEQEGQKR